ncbi:molybdenum cofactor guanylyltransferase MobA [Halioxenophilus aromaticivorans]|uniref:Molybdenum cofactor guanylyltransferase n=1 Tax=Halioxenophilus aromaticivorans TaxID=1306992 RepID=A0AAV3U5X7_9ALTE
MLQPQPTTQPIIVGAILAGGESRRFNYQTKALIDLNGKPLIEHCLDRLAPQGLATIAVCANQNPALTEYGLPCIEELDCAIAGPLRGLYSALEWAHKAAGDALLLTVPCDTPLLPLNLVEELTNTLLLTQDDCVIASSNGRLHPTIGLWRTNLLQRLADHIAASQKGSLKAWLSQCRFTEVNFCSTQIDPFVNVNSQSDLNNLTQALAPK